MKEIMYTFRTKNFVVRAYIEPDEDMDLSWDDDGEAKEKLANGEYTAFQTTVLVKYKGCELGADYLGGCVYADPNDFFTEHYGIAAKSRRDGCNYGAYFPQMVREAIATARRRLANIPKLRPYADDWRTSQK
jgi:hypothetical protein